MKRILVLAALALSACAPPESFRYKSYPAYPWSGLETVAVLPVWNQTRVPFDGLEFGNILASELAKFEGVRIIRPILLGNPEFKTADDVIKFGRSIKVDAILVCAITDYDPYNPPKIAVSVQCLRVSGRKMAGGDIDELTRSASWRKGPLALSRNHAGNFVAQFETVYDAHEERIRREVLAYAQAQEEGDTPFQGDREFLSVQTRYFQFVSNQLINQLFFLAPDA